MSPLDKVSAGHAAEKKVTVTPEMTVGHVVPGMPAVYSTPMMILHMEMAAGSAIQSFLPAGYVSVGMMVDIPAISRQRRSAAPYARLRGSPRSKRRASCSRSKPGTATARSATATTGAASSMSQNSRNGSA
jgi:hypothetical protein